MKKYCYIVNLFLLNFIRIMRCLLLFLSFVVITSDYNIISAQNYPDADNGSTKPRPQKTKKAKIKYEFHKGIALTKSDMPLVGEFKYTESKNEVPYYEFIDYEAEGRKKKVALSMIKQLTLAGAERGISARNDSTEFVWIDRFKDLYRAVRKGNLLLYDNSRIVDEPYEYLTDYILLAGRENYPYKIISKLSDIEPLMVDKPYFMASAKATNRLKTEDFRVIIYLTDLFNDADPMRVLRWDTLQIETKDGKIVTGRGYIQPLDIRDEYVKLGNAYLHFYNFNTNSFELYDQQQIKTIKQNGEIYLPAYYSVAGKKFFCTNWKYNDDNYMVARRIIQSNNYFFKAKNTNGQDIVILKEVGGSYMRPLNEPDLRTAYMAEKGLTGN